MSLRTTWGDANKETKVLLDVRYTTEFFGENYYFRMTRTATKSYSFVGMTREVAEACAAAKIAEYTRLVCREDGENPVTDPDGRTHPGVVMELVCVADVAPRQDHGDSWRVDISVDESDFLNAKDPPVDCVSAFAPYVAGRTYDETISGLTITAITTGVVQDEGHTDLSVTNSGLADLAPDEIFAEYKSDSTASAWTKASVDRELTTAAKVRIKFAATDGMLFRVIARSRVSPAAIYTEE